MSRRKRRTSHAGSGPGEAPRAKRRPSRPTRGRESGRNGLAARLGRARIALLIARRSAARARGRSALIVALVALPVAGMAAVTLIIPSTIATTAERLTATLGQTQAMVQVISAPDPELSQDPFGMGWGGGSPSSIAARQDPASLFPVGTRMIPLLQTSVTVTTKTGVATLSATEGKAWDPALRGRYNLTSGHAPTQANEILVTASTLDRLGIQLGGTVDILAPVTRTATVVGLLDNRTLPSNIQVLYGLPGTFTGETAIGQNPQSMFYLPDTVVTWEQVKQLNTQGAIVLSRDVFLNPPDPSSLTVTGGSGNSSAIAFMLAGMVLAFGLLEVMLLAGAAFTVGARAQERSLATIASVGAERRTVFSIVTATGLVLGAIGGLIGVGAGIGIGSLFMVLTSNGSATQYWGYHLWWPVMIGIAVTAIGIGWLGALVPAIRASKIDVVSALRGARRPAAPRRRRPIIGLAITLTGIALTLVGGGLAIALTNSRQFFIENPLTSLTIGMLIAGPILIQLGLVFCSGLVLRTLARLLSHASVAARLASRDTARNAGRSVPVLAVIMTCVFVAVLAMTMIASSEATSRITYQYSMMPGQVQLVLGSWNPQTNQFEKFDNPDDYAAALSANLDVDSVRILKAVPDARGMAHPGRSHHDPDALLPDLVVPPDNQCPSDFASVNFDEATQAPGSDAARRAAADWRCQSPYVLWGASGDGRGHIWVGDADDLALILGTGPSQAAKDALSRGDAVSFYPEYVADGEVTISWWSASDWENGSMQQAHTPPAQTRTVPAVVEKPAHPIRFGIFLPTATADKLGLDYVDAVAQAATTTPPTDAQLDALRSDLDTVNGTINSADIQVERGPANTATAFSWGILGLSTIIALGASAVAIGLARSDGRQDEATLAAIGSSPWLRRSFGFWQVVMTAGVGSVLGAAVGLVPVVALTLPGANLVFSAPWLPIAAIAVLMPLAIACGTWLFTGRRKLQHLRAAIE